MKFSFIGISQSILATSYVKWIDVWMIFTMIVPLLEITSHTYSEHLKMKQEEVDEQKETSEISDVDRDKR